MTTAPLPPTETLDAGEFADWVHSMTSVLYGSDGSTVPCGNCVGCCSSFWPVALRDTDTEILQKVPPSLLLEPSGHQSLHYMGYREDGTCPLLTSGGCSVYAIRPQTCRDFDCRLFTATGIDSAGADKPLINERIRRWQFRYTDAQAEAAHAAMQATARLLLEARDTPLGQRLPRSPIAVAGLAFKGHRALMGVQPPDESADDRLVRVLAAARAFDLAAPKAAAP